MLGRRPRRSRFLIVGTLAASVLVGVVFVLVISDDDTAPSRTAVRDQGLTGLVSIGGDDPLSRVAAADFEDEHPDVRLTAFPEAGHFGAFCGGDAEVLVSRKIRPREAADCAERDVAFLELPVGRGSRDAAPERSLFVYFAADALDRPEVRAFAELYVEQDQQLARQAGLVPLSDERAAKARALLESAATG